jgi:hypothetical protein
MGQPLLPEVEGLLGLEGCTFGEFRPRLDYADDRPAVSCRQTFPRPAAMRPAKRLPERFYGHGFRFGKDAFPCIEGFGRVSGERETAQMFVDPLLNESGDCAFFIFAEADGNGFSLFF